MHIKERLRGDIDDAAVKLVGVGATILIGIYITAAIFGKIPTITDTTANTTAVAIFGTVMSAFSLLGVGALVLGAVGILMLLRWLRA